MARRKKPVTKEFTYVATVRGTAEERVMAYRELTRETQGHETKVLVVENWRGPNIIGGAKLRKLLREAGVLQPNQAPEPFRPRSKFDVEADVKNRSWG